MTNSPALNYIDQNKIQVTLILSFVLHVVILFAFQMQAPGSHLKPHETTIDLVDLQETLPEPPKPREVVKKPADEPAEEPVQQIVALPSAPKKQIFLPFYKVDQLPVFLTQTMPAYPEQARKLGRTSQVILEAYIDANGDVRDVKILKSGGEFFDLEAIKALKKSTFKPAKIMGKTVPVKIRVPYLFNLDKL